jgi:hypothetical protein
MDADPMQKPSNVVIPAEMPRVTDVLKGAGLIDVTWISDEARDRGSYIHAATVIDEQGDLDEDYEPTRRYSGYIGAWRKFLSEHACRWDMVEQRLENNVYRFTGQPDRVGKVDGHAAVVDIKSGCKAAWHPLQLSAYQSMLPGGNYRRIVVRLQVDGYYQMDVFDLQSYPADLNVFLSALAIHNWRKANGNGNH